MAGGLAAADINAVAIPLLALGFAANTGGMMLQHMQNRKVLWGGDPIWKASLQPWTDGDQHGLAFAIRW